MSDIECQCSGSSQTVCSTCYIDLLQQLATITQERDALREVLRALIRAGDALYTKGKFADPDYWAACNWVTVVEESAALISPPAGAGNGKEVGK